MTRQEILQELENIKGAVEALQAAFHEPTFRDEDVKNRNITGPESRLTLLFRKTPRPFSEKELKAYLKAQVSEKELDLVTKFYQDPAAEFKRTSLVTLLNNWSGEVDKASKKYNHGDQTRTISRESNLF